MVLTQAAYTGVYAHKKRAKQMPKITKKTVDAAAPDPGRRYFIWDEQIPGFGLLVLTSGVKSYVFQYRSPDSGSHRMTLGKHGALTPDEARKKAEKYRREIADGRDPYAETNERRKAATVADILDAYLASEAFAAKADSTRATDRGRIHRHIKPTLGKAKVDQLKPEAIKRAFAAIRDGDTAVDEKTGFRRRSVVTGGPGTAKKAVRLLSAVFRWAVDEGLAASNPATGIKTGADGSRDTIIQDTETYSRLFKTMDVMESERRIRQPVADAIRVIALTGARRGEVAGMKWADVDLKSGLVTLAVHKTAKSTGKPRVIGLPAAAAALIARQPEGNPDGYVFGTARGNGPVSLTKPWRAIRAEAELPHGIGLHGLRHSLATHMAVAGAQASEIMTALGHKNLATSQKYIHWAGDARQAIAEKGAAVALAGLAGAASGRGAEVVPLKGAHDG
jgi:integrase